MSRSNQQPNDAQLPDDGAELVERVAQEAHTGLVEACDELDVDPAAVLTEMERIHDRGGGVEQQSKIEQDIDEMARSLGLEVEGAQQGLSIDEMARSLGLEVSDTDDGPTWPNSDWRSNK